MLNIGKFSIRFFGKRDSDRCLPDPPICSRIGNNRQVSADLSPCGNHGLKLATNYPHQRPRDERARHTDATDPWAEISEMCSGLVPEVGLEPTSLAAGDFESPASTNSATRAPDLRGGAVAATRGACGVAGAAACVNFQKRDQAVTFFFTLNGTDPALGTYTEDHEADGATSPLCVSLFRSWRSSPPVHTAPPRLPSRV